MNKLFSLPHKYVTGNTFQRKHTLEAIEQFKDKIKWGTKPNSSLLDVGCGTGDVTIDYVEPQLSNNYKSIVGVDISPGAINFAKKTYEGKFPRAKFEVMDIADKDLKIKEQFDHVTSFYSLNFVQNQRQAMKNIYDLLKPDGDMFHVVMGQFHVFLVLDVLMGNPKFRPHMLDVATYASPYRYSETPAEDFTAVLKEAGFKDIDCRANRSYFIYDRNQVDKFVSMVHFISSEVSDDLRQEFYTAFFNTMKEMEMVSEENGKTYIKIPYQNLVAYAKKY